MEFRIAPLLVSIFNTLLMLFINPSVNTKIPLKAITPWSKFVIPFLILHLMAWGMYSRHSFYTKTFKVVFIILQIGGVFLAIHYWFVLRQQHLG